MQVNIDYPKPISPTSPAFFGDIFWNGDAVWCTGKKNKSNYLGSHPDSFIILAVPPRQVTTFFYFTFLIGKMKTVRYKSQKVILAKVKLGTCKEFRTVCDITQTFNYNSMVFFYAVTFFTFPIVLTYAI